MYISNRAQVHVSWCDVVHTEGAEFVARKRNLTAFILIIISKLIRSTVLRFLASNSIRIPDVHYSYPLLWTWARCVLKYQTQKWCDRWMYLIFWVYPSKMVYPHVNLPSFHADHLCMMHVILSVSNSVLLNLRNVDNSWDQVYNNYMNLLQGSDTNLEKTHDHPPMYKCT